MTLTEAVAMLAQPFDCTTADVTVADDVVTVSVTSEVYDNVGIRLFASAQVETTVADAQLLATARLVNVVALVTTAALFDYPGACPAGN